MRVPPVDRPLDEAEWRAFVVAEGFGHLAVAGAPGRAPIVQPTQFVPDGDEVVLHLAVDNPIVDALRRAPAAVLSVAGDWAFVPSAWKAIGAEDPALGIPTTYYAAVQLTGPVAVHDDPDETAAILRRQLAMLQPGLAVADPAAAHRARLSQIRGLTLHVEEVVARFKYGGNVDEPHRLEVLQHLEDRDGPGDRAAAAHLRRRVASSDQGAGGTDWANRKTPSGS